MPLRLTINGQVNDFPELQEGTVLAALLDRLALKADRVAVEQNGTLIRRNSWAQATLRAGDRLEIVHFVGGGSVAPIAPRVN